MPINTMGKANKKWGVCGFTSAFYGMYMHSNSIEKGKLTNAVKVNTRVLAEIKTYLVMLQANGPAEHLAHINSFCSSFEGYEGFSVANFVRDISNVTTAKSGQDSADFSIGMPPQTIQHYLRTVCGFRNATYVCEPLAYMPLLGSAKNELIIGVSDPSGKMKAYGGLCHYMYQKDGKIYSWGKKFSSVAEAGATQDMEDWKVCVEIELTN